MARPFVGATVVSLGATALVTLGTGPATAGEWSLHAAFDGYLAATDNVFSASEDPGVVGAPAVESDAYAQLRPGLLYTYEAPRAIHELSGELDATGYAVHGEAWSLAGRGGWRGFFVISPRTEAGTSVQAGYGQSNTLTSTVPASEGQTQLLPAGSVDITTVLATQHLTHALSEDWQLSQNATGQLVRTAAGDSAGGMDTSTQGVDAGLALGVERSWREHALGVEAGAAFNSLRADVMGAPVTQSQLLARATLRWRYDLARRWSSSVDGGAATLVSASVTDAWTIRPTVGAQLSYAPEWGMAQLAVRRNVTPNLFIAQNTIATGANLSALVPLPWLSRDPRAPELAVAASAAYERTEILDLAADSTTSTFDLLAADVALTWQPKPAVGFALRYQLAQQSPRGDGETAGLAAIAYLRNTAMITFTARWPERPAGEIPKRTGRVDRRDVTPITGEI
jgi:hypothetical protein